jgi:hypothetical protein
MLREEAKGLSPTQTPDVCPPRTSSYAEVKVVSNPMKLVHPESLTRGFKANSWY